jgi:hypothetical protein
MSSLEAMKLRTAKLNMAIMDFARKLIVPADEIQLSYLVGCIMA